MAEKRPQHNWENSAPIRRTNGLAFVFKGRVESLPLRQCLEVRDNYCSLSALVRTFDRHRKGPASSGPFLFGAYSSTLTPQHLRFNNYGSTTTTSKLSGTTLGRGWGIAAVAGGVSPNCAVTR